MDEKALKVLERIAAAVEAMAAGVGHVPKSSEPDATKESAPKDDDD